MKTSSEKEQPHAAVLADRDLCILMNSKWTIGQQCACAAVKTGSILGCMSKSIAGKLREEMITLYVAVMRLSLKCYDQFGALPVKERYYQNEGCAAKGNWNGVRGIQGKDEGCGVLQAKKAHGGSNCCLQLPSRL